MHNVELMRRAGCRHRPATTGPIRARFRPVGPYPSEGPSPIPDSPDPTQARPTAFQSFELTAISLRSLPRRSKISLKQAKQDFAPLRQRRSENRRAPRRRRRRMLPAKPSRMEGQSGAACPSNEGLVHFMLQAKVELSQAPKGLSENAEATLARAIHNVSRSRSPISSLKELSQVK